MSPPSVWITSATPHHQIRHQIRRMSAVLLRGVPCPPSCIPSVPLALAVSSPHELHSHSAVPPPLRSVIVVFYLYDRRSFDSVKEWLKQVDVPTSP